MLEIVPDIAQSTHGIRNIFADIRNVPTITHMVLGMFLLPFPVDPPVVERDTFGNSSAQQNSDNDSDNDDVVCEIFLKYFF